MTFDNIGRILVEQSESKATLSMTDCRFGVLPCIYGEARNFNSIFSKFFDMPPTNLQHRRTHNLLLISKLLNQRDAASPFTLCLDSLEQSAKPLVAYYLKRAKVRVRVEVRDMLSDGDS